MSSAACLEHVAVLCTVERHASCANSGCPLLALERSAVADITNFDEEIEALCEEGSRELYNQEITDLYDQLSAQVYRSVRRGLPHEDAEEVVNDAFLAARKHWERVRSYDDPAAYVFAAARNLRLKVLAYYLRIPKTEAFTELPLPDPCGHVDVRVQVHDALRILSPRQAEVVLLHYWVGLPTRALATELGISDGNVKRILSEARMRLRDALTDRKSPPIVALPPARKSC